MDRDWNRSSITRWRWHAPRLSRSRPLSDADQARLDELSSVHNALCDEDDGPRNLPRSCKPRTEIEALTGAEQYQPTISPSLARSLPRLSREPRIERGFIRAEDWKAKASAGKAVEAGWRNPPAIRSSRSRKSLSPN